MVLERRTKVHSGSAHGGEGLRWLVTYADMITLLMAFFIMLYSMSVMNMAKFRQLAISVKSGFGGDVSGKGLNIISPGSDVNLHPGIGPTAPPPPLHQVERQVRESLGKAGLSKVTDVYHDPRGLVIRFRSDAVLFDRGSATLRPTAKLFLKPVIDKIRPLSNSVRIEGHTCNLPIRSGQFPSNWELSTARATNVIRYLIAEGGFPMDRLSAAGYAESRPIAPNDSEANRARNRRVDIVVLEGQASREEPNRAGIDIRSLLADSMKITERPPKFRETPSHASDAETAGVKGEQAGQSSQHYSK